MSNDEEKVYILVETKIADKKRWALSCSFSLIK